MTLLLDTTVFIDYLRAYAPALSYLDSKIYGNSVFFSAISETELLVAESCNDILKRATILHFLSRWKKVPVSNPIAVIAGDLCRKHALEVPDALIAASALYTNSELITRNIKHFSMIKGLTVKEPY